MATLCKTFPTAESVLDAAEALDAGGVPSGDIGVLIGRRYHDVRAESVGGFGGPLDPEAPFGKYAGPPRSRWRAAGGFIAHPDDQRQGSFDDTDRILSVTRQDGDVHVEVTDDDHARHLLTRARVPDDVAQRMVEQLHAGEAIMFVQLAEVDLGTAEALIRSEGGGGTSPRSRGHKRARESSSPTGPVAPAEHDVTRGRSAGTAENPRHDPTRGRSAGSADNPAGDPTRGQPAATGKSQEHDPGRSQESGH
ncbi:MAG: hypothetical protein WAL63_13395 [Solirubrobacteraceae bacterium]